MSRWRIAVTAGMLAVATVFCYRETRTFEFVDFDDNEYVYLNQHVLDGLTPQSVRWALTDLGFMANWHPLTWLSYQADVSWLGKPLVSEVGARRDIRNLDMIQLSAIMHTHNVLLHGCNAALLFLLLVGLLQALGLSGGKGDGREWGYLCWSAAAAWLWAVHPLRCEVVCWISERKECLSVFWALLSLIAYQAYVGTLQRRLGYGFSVLAYAVALSAKPVAVGLPAIVIGLNLLNNDKADQTFWKRIGLTRTLPFIVLSAISCVLTLAAQRGAMMPLYSASFGARLVNALSSIGIYLQQSLLPINLIALYPFSERFNPGHVLVGAIVCVAFLAVFLRVLFALVKRTPLGETLKVATVIGAWCLVGLVPMLGILQVGSQAHADRYTYWVGCGFAFAVAWAGSKLSEVFASRRAAAVMGTVVLAACIGSAVLCQRQARVWKDTLTLFSHAYEKSGGNSWAAYCLAEQIAFHDPARAERLYRQSLSKAQHDENLSGLAMFLAVNSDGRHFDEAIALATKAIGLTEKSVRAYEALGLVYLRKGMFAEAEKQFEHAIQNGSENPIVKVWLAEASARKESVPKYGPRMPH